jgi:hypothetical protein
VTTLSDIVEEVLLDLEGYIEDQDVFGVLRAGISAESTSIDIDGSAFPDGSGFSPGIIEIGDELVYVQSVDKATGNVTALKRGWRGTTAQGWTAGTLVRNAPRLPKVSIKRAINDTLLNFYPRVYVIKTYEFSAQGSRITYDMPADCREVVDVAWSLPGPSRKYQQVRRWQFDRNAPSASTTGRSIEVYDTLPGRTVKVTYEAEAIPFTNLTDDWSVTGLPVWLRELAVLGACARVLMNVDAGAIGARSAEQRLINANFPVGTGSTIARQYMQLFETRMQAAEERLRQEYDTRVRYTY